MTPERQGPVMRDSSTTAAVRDACQRLGYELNDDRAVRLADPGDDPVPVAGGPATVEVSEPDSTDPHAALSLVARAAARDRVALLVARDTAAADRLVATLADPPLVAGETDTGERTFHVGNDRVHLAEGGLALYVVAEGPPYRTPEFEWREERAADATTAGTRTPTGADEKRLVLAADGERVTTLGGVETLACPGPARERFTHYYERGDDRLIHVSAADGGPTGVFDTVSAMRGRGFVPVPAPVVPEHVFHDADRAPRRSWAVLDAETGRVHADAGPVAADRHGGR